MNASAVEPVGLKGRLRWVSWTTWLFEVLTAGVVVFLLGALIVLTAFNALSGEWAPWVAGLLLIIVTPVMAGAVHWLRGRWWKPLTVLRIQHALAGAAVIGLFFTLSYATQGLGMRRFASQLFAMQLASIPVVWAIYRVCFLRLLRWSGLTDDRTLEERMRPVRFLVGYTAFLTAMVLVDWVEGLVREGVIESLWILPGVLGILAAYKVITQITEWRIRRKLEAAAAAASNGN